MKRTGYFAWIILLVCVLALAGCSSQGKKKNNRKTTQKSQKETETTQNSNQKATVVVLKTDIEKKEITLQEVGNQNRFVLSYTGGTQIISRHDRQMTMEQVELGEIAQIEYSPQLLKLYELQISKSSWEKSEVDNLQINKEERRMSIGSDNYRYDSDLVSLSDGRQITLLEINDVDVLTVRGEGSQVHSIVVTRGHGYVRLKKADFFVDGLIEVGSKIMLPVSKDMLIVAPEGECKITVTKNGKGGSGDYNIKRNEETTVNVSDFQEVATRKGAVKFIIEPDNAQLFVDNAKVNYSEYVTLPYGNHVIQVSAEGYKTVEDTIVVDSVYMDKKIILEEIEKETESDKEDKEDETESDSEKSESTTKETESDKKSDNDKEEKVEDKKHVIKIEKPDSVSVYFDGTYKGVSPVSFGKVSGKHTITLSRGGVSNIAYSVDIPNDGEDVEFSFPDLANVSG